MGLSALTSNKDSHYGLGVIPPASLCEKWECYKPLKKMPAIPHGVSGSSPPLVPFFFKKNFKNVFFLFIPHHFHLFVLI